jgi:hypothetical protein
MEVTELARKHKSIPNYGTVIHNGVEYYRTRVEDADGKRVRVGECTILNVGAKIHGNTHRLEWETYTPSCPFFKTKEQQEEGRKRSETMQAVR